MRSSILALMVLALGAAGLAGCDLFGDQSPDEVRLRIEAGGPQQVLLVTTSNFIAQRQPVFDDFGFPLRDTTLVQVFAADTTVVTLPFEQRYDIRVPQRFFTRVFRRDSTDVEIRMQAWVDGEGRFDRRLGAAPTDTLLQFLYFFTGSSRPIEEPPVF